MKTLALSTAMLALLSGASLAQTTAPQSSDPTTSTGAEQAPLTGRDAAPMDDAMPERDTGNMGGEPAINAPEGNTPGMESDTGDTPMADEAAPMTDGATTPEGGTARSTPPAGTADPMTEGTDPMAGGAAMDNSGSMDGTMTPPEGYEPVMMEQLNADMLMDATIYDANESSVGDISAVTPEQGMPEQVIVDVGGFLGIGAKPVSLNLSELTFYSQTEGDEVRGYTMMTEEELKELPEYTE